MGGRQSSSSVSSTASASGNNAALSQNERNSPHRRAGAGASTSSASGGTAFDGDALHEVEFSEDAAAILQRLTVASASRARIRGSLPVNNAAASDSRRTRARTSLSSNGHAQTAANTEVAREASSSESDDEDEDDLEERAAASRRPASFPPRGGHRFPFRFGFFPMNGIKCPICKQMQQPNEFELHLVMCLTKPRVTYNEDVLAADKDEECAICLEELKQGENIARLPCLCVFHKRCIDDWFRVRQTCPNHPGD